MRSQYRTPTSNRPRQRGVSAATLTAGALVLVLVLAAACGNVYEASDKGTGNASQSNGTNPGGTAGSGGSNPTGAVDKSKLKQKNPSTQPGVTDDTIRVGGVAATTNILKLPLDQAFNGVQAYFDMVNSEGGMYGRKLEIVSKRDDQMTKNKEEAQGLVSQDNVFAVAPVATVLFTGAGVLADAKIPTFGWSINPEYGGPPNLYADKGSHLCTSCAYPAQSFVARENGISKVALLTYGVDQSKECAVGVKAGFEKHKVAEVVFTDDTVPFGTTDYGVQVQKMKQAGVQMVVTCMDTSGVINLARELTKQNANIIQYMQNGYDYDLLADYPKEFEGSIMMTQFVPLEFGQRPAGLENYVKWIEKIPGAKKGEISLGGWLAADMLYRGLAMAGPDFTREKVISNLNQVTNWNADGITPGWDWTIVHEADMPAACQAFSKILDGKFVPQFTEPGKPFVCFAAADPLPDKPRRKASGE